jgi:UTP--glucose-1-phosphate uridylyltransferase
LLVVTQALIPAAGLGTRLLPLSWAIPKELLPIGTKPALQRIAEELAAAGANRFCLVTSPRKADIDALFRSDDALKKTLTQSNKSDLLRTLWSYGPHSDVEILTCVQEQQRGLGHAVLCGEQGLRPEPFILALGDSLMHPYGHCSLTNRLVQTFNEHHADAVIAFQQVPQEHVSRYGIAATRESTPVFVVEDLIEKPSPETAPSNLAIAARYVFRESIFDYLRQLTLGKDGELQLTDAIRALIRGGGKVLGVRLAPGEHRVDVGNFRDYATAFIEQALCEDPELKTRMRKLLAGDA